MSSGIADTSSTSLGSVSEDSSATVIFDCELLTFGSGRQVGTYVLVDTTLTLKARDIVPDDLGAVVCEHGRGLP